MLLALGGAQKGAGSGAPGKDQHTARTPFIHEECGTHHEAVEHGHAGIIIVARVLAGDILVMAVGQSHDSEKRFTY